MVETHPYSSISKSTIHDILQVNQRYQSKAMSRFILLGVLDASNRRDAERWLRRIKGHHHVEAK